MKIAILHPSYDGSEAPFARLDPACDVAPYLTGHELTDYFLRKATAVRDVTQIVRRGFDVVINLCDGAWDQDTAGIDVVQALERLNAAFTGAGSLFYDPSREAMKMACWSADVKFPAYVMARRPPDIESALERLRFPMLVKHPRGYASTGLTRSSRVEDAASLRDETERIMAEYGGALIEEFIEGREFTVLVAEARHAGEDAWTLDPLEFVFPEGESFKHFDLKWKDYEAMGTRPVRDPELAALLRAICARTFIALSGSGYGRCDIRMDESGDLYMLEINPNCGVFYPEGQFGSADFILANDPAGHRGFLEHLLAGAVRRRDRNRRRWELRFVPRRGFGLFAAEPIAPGEIALRYEERAHTLVSRCHADRHWNGLRREWFHRYAWPLNSSVYAAWSENPEDWRPINHSCDPNTWLEGLNLVARRQVAAHEELTVDYATFCGPDMAEFECSCGTRDCRRTVRGDDYLMPDIRQRYLGHMSDFTEAGALRTFIQSS